MKIRSLTEFEEAMDSEFSWRKREITTLRFNLKGARRHVQLLSFRCGIVLLYAHWEGLVKFSAKSYLSHLNYLGISYKAIKPCFLYFVTKSKIDNSGMVNLQNFTTFEKAQKMFTLPVDDKFKIDPESCISTRENQNLTSKEFKSIICKLGLPYLPEYELREKLIDDKLMFYRNQIAHGESLRDQVDDVESAFELLSKDILHMLELLRTSLSDSIENKLYKA